MNTIVGIAQFAPEVLDLGASIRKAATIIAAAAKEGAALLAFPETWLPVYPVWADLGFYNEWGNPRARKLHARLYRNSIELGSDEFRLLSKSISKSGLWVTIGVNERAGRSIYNSLMVFNPKGKLVLHRRKLVPTFGERLVWSHGDAVDLDVVDAGFGRVGGLICWEHWMPPARQVLHEAGETIHVAAWPHGKEHHQVASRHYAFEGRCFVLAAAMYLRRNMFPSDFEFSSELGKSPAVLLDGGSAIIGPDGSYVVKPVFGREKLVLAEIDTSRAEEETITLDVAGHYSRPDVFELHVTRKRRRTGSRI